MATKRSPPTSAGYLRVLVAHRDAKRLLDIGRDAATEDYLRLVAKVIDTSALPAVIQAVAVSKAKELIELYDGEPSAWPAGRSADSATAAALKLCRKLYRRGKCTLCGGAALPCARRHAHGRDCDG